MDEVRIVAWSWSKIKANNLNYTISQWCLNPKACLGIVKLFEFRIKIFDWSDKECVARFIVTVCNLPPAACA